MENKNKMKCYQCGNDEIKKLEARYEEYRQKAEKYEWLATEHRNRANEIAEKLIPFFCPVNSVSQNEEKEKRG